MSIAIDAPRRTAVPTPPMHTGLRALIRRGLLDNRRTPLIWGAPIGVMSALIVALYPSIHHSLTDVVKGYPAGLKSAFGITDLGTLEAFLSAEMFSLLLPIAAAYCAMRCVSAALAGAEESGYADALLATPVTRRQLVVSAFATAAVVVAAMLVVSGVLTAAATTLTGQGIDGGRLVGALAGVWGLAVFFAGCAALASGLLHRAAAVLGVGAGVLATMYLVDVLGKLADGVQGLRWLSAFRLYGTPLQDGLDVAGLAGLLVLGVLLAAAGAIALDHRDITG